MKTIFTQAFMLLCSAVLLAETGKLEGFGVAAFPSAIFQPEIARAMEDYYRPGIRSNQAIQVAVLVTTTEFQQVYDFYAPRAAVGKWGWRRKEKSLLQLTETLKFNRAQFISQQPRGSRGIPEKFTTLFGDPALSQEQFNQKLDRLVKENKDAKLNMVEGSRRIAGDPANSQLRILVERPYIDVVNWRLTDKTRIVLIKVSDASDQGR